MSTECVPPLDISEDMLDTQEQHCKLLENLSEQLMRNCVIQKNARTEKTLQDSTANNKTDQKLPRRKDTPVLQNPQFVPDFSEILLKRFYEIEQKQKTQISPVLSKEPNLMKPRRKDTPVLPASPHLPGSLAAVQVPTGVKLVKEGKSTIIVESEENDT